MSRNTPSQFLREAILEYSRERRRSRQRSRERSSEVPAPPATPSQEPILESVFSDPAQPSVDIKKSESTVLDRRSDQKQSLSTIGDISSSFFHHDDSDALCFTVEPDKDTTLLESGPMYFDKEKETLYSELHEPGKKTYCPCSSSPKYYVQHELKDGDKNVQTRFIQKILTVLLVKAFVILGWLKIIEYVARIADHYKEQYHYHYITGGFYGIAKLSIRIETGGTCRRRHRCIIAFFLLFELILASDFLGCVVVHLLDNQFSIPRRVLYCVAGAYLFFIIVGGFVTYDMQDGIMVGTAFIITAICTIHQFVHYKTSMGLEVLKLHTTQGMDELFCALTVLSASEIIMMVIMTELRSILGGQRYVLYPSDWLYTSIYLI